MQPNATIENLKIDQTITALLSNPTLAKAAQSLGIDESTLWRRLQDPSTQRSLKEAKKRIYGQSLTRLQATASEAVDVLSEVMLNKNTPPNSRIAAARSLLELATKAVQLEDLEERISGIETALKISNR